MAIVWMYPPSLPPAIVAAVLYGIVTLYLGYQTLVRYRAWYFGWAVLGGVLETAGFALRCYSVQNQEKLVPFILTLTLLVLAPLLLAASVYLLLGRLILRTLPASHHHLFGRYLHARHTTRFFVFLDLLAAVVQSSGSAVAASDDWSGPMALTGVDVLIAGLAMQAGAFVLFLGVLGRFAWMVRKGGAVVVREDAPRGWERLVLAEWVAGVLILIRCIYRLAEFAGGVEGYVFKNEWPFWVFEGLPILVATVVFCIWHPGACLGRDGGKRLAGDETELSAAGV